MLMTIDGNNKDLALTDQEMCDLLNDLFNAAQRMAGAPLAPFYDHIRRNYHGIPESEMEDIHRSQRRAARAMYHVLYEVLDLTRQEVYELFGISYNKMKAGYGFATEDEIAELQRFCMDKSLSRIRDLPEEMTAKNIGHYLVLDQSTIRDYLHSAEQKIRGSDIGKEWNLERNIADSATDVPRYTITKENVVQKVDEHGGFLMGGKHRGVAELARRHGIHEHTLRRWYHEARARETA